MSKQAKKGGEYGANGEWYEGGRFINTIPENAKKEGSTKKKPRKVEIEPYKWVMAEEGQVSIYQQLAGVFGKVVGGVMIFTASEQTLKYYGKTEEEVKILITRWNNGERWM